MSCYWMTIGTKMTIQTIISSNYYRLKSKCHNDYKVISLSRTSEDILQDVCLTALRKYNTQEITEEEGIEYLEKTLFYELKFQPNRVDPRMVYTDDLTSLESEN